MKSVLVRRYADVLELANRGRFAEKCDEHLQNAISALEALPSEKGSATITVEMKINYDSGRVDIVPSVKSRLPEGKAFAATAMWTHDGALSLQHPSQTDMFAGPEEAEARQRRRENVG